jgi:hypothetical protein
MGHFPSLYPYKMEYTRISSHNGVTLSLAGGTGVIYTSFGGEINTVGGFNQSMDSYPTTSSSYN